MNAKLLTALVLAATGALSAQSNTVPGLDGRLVTVDNLTYWGRRGSAYPNGEVGMSMLNNMCNPGSVQIPWHAPMAADHPKFAFIITRESGGRMVQISNWSYCKHAFTSVNTNGACGSCQNPGTGSVMGLNCSDTYGAGNNADRNYLGPPEEIDPWTGVWNPVGSYFDRGDPPVSGSAATDGQRSLNTSGFDSVKNRVTVQEQDMLVAGAQYYYGIHLIHQGESDANRHDNLASRGFVPSGSAGGWSFNNNGVGQVYGSILQHWTNATIDKGKNGNDDGNFYVAVVVTPLGGSMYHYEYAIHNADNARGGGAYRIPIDPAGVVSNMGFRDIDTNAGNDWTANRVGNELVFTAPVTNPHNWNTIYNVWFDCDIAPSLGSVLIDEARPGAGQNSVAVLARVPSGIPTAFVTSVGTGCGSCTSSFYEEFSSASGMDLANNGMTLTYANNAYSVGSATASFHTPTGTNLNMTDDSQSTVNLPFSLPFPGGSTNQLVVCSNGFISTGSGNGTDFSPTSGELLTSSAPRWALLWHDLNPGNSGSVIVDTLANAVVVTWLNVPNFSGGGANTFQAQFQSNGTVHVLWQSLTAAGNGYVVGFSRGGSSTNPGSIDLTTAIPAGFSICTSDVTGLVLSASDRPILGTSITLDTAFIPSPTAFGATVLSLTQSIPPIDLGIIGAPGCFAHAIGGDTFNFTPTGSTHQIPLSIPNDNAITGVSLATQTYTASPGFNALGIIVSNGLILTLGQR